MLREVLHPSLPRLREVLASWEPLPMVNAEPPFLCVVMECACQWPYRSSFMIHELY